METQAFTDVLYRWENIATMVGVWVFVHTLYRAAPTFAKSTLGATLQPLMPLAITQAAVWFPGLQPDDMRWGARVMLGLVLGFGAAHAVKIVKQTILRKDPRIRPQTELPIPTVPKDV